MVSCRASLISLAVVSVLVLQAQGQLNCYATGFPCDSSISTGFVVVNTFGECCTLPEANLVQSSPGVETCETCRGFGWISGNVNAANTQQRLVTLEEGETTELSIGFSKGEPPSFVVDIRVEVQAGSASGDFSVTNVDVPLRLSLGVGLDAPRTVPINVTALIDSIGLEPTETFTLTVVVISNTNPTTPFPPGVLGGSAYFFISSLVVSIVDTNGVSVEFSEVGYSQGEALGDMLVQITLSIANASNLSAVAIASDLNLRVVTQNLTQVFLLSDVSPLRELPADFPALDPFDPATPYIASSVDGTVATVDYSTSNVSIRVPAGPATSITVPITLFDDAIDEAESEFFVLFLESDNARVDLTGRFAALATIRDNEVTQIGFEFARYTFTESQSDLVILDVFVVKANSQQTELTFTIGITPTTDGITPAATIGEDFLIQDDELISISPLEQSVMVPFVIRSDDIPEATESFRLEISNRGNNSFDISTATTTVFIEDDDEVTIGFEQTAIAVLEEDREVQLCLVVVSPLANVSLALDYTVRVETVPGTAGSGDFTAMSATLVFTDTDRRGCITVNISADGALEETETFSATAMESPDVDGLVLVDDVVVVTITDQDTVQLGYEQAAYAVTEETGILLLCVTVSNGSLGTSLNVTSTLTGGDATEGDDYSGTMATLVFSEVSARSCHQVLILPDNVPEAAETFAGTLSLSNDVIARGLQGRISLRPDETVVTIAASDQSLEVSFAQNVFTFAEGDGSVSISVTKTGSHVSPVSVRVAGGPSVQTDVAQSAPAIDTTLSFAPSDSALSVNFDLSNDAVALEAVESFSVGLEVVTAPADLNVTVSGPATINVVDDDSVAVTFQQSAYSVREDAGSLQVCVVKDAATIPTVSVTVSTASDSAISPQDFIAVTSLTLNLGRAAGSVACFDISIVPDTVVDAGESFSVVIDSASPDGVAFRDTTTVSIIDSGRTGEVLVNDTVTADPVFSVPLNIPNLGAVGLPGPSLSICFELRGRDNTLFNLVSDQCLSVNAHYTPVNNTSFRIIDNVAIRAAGNSRMCHNIDVSRMSCNATVNGTLGPFDFDGINVRTYAERIRVSVPNCDEQKVVVYFYCARSNLTESGISTEANFFRVRVVRGLNFGHRDSHGIIGQFWNVPATIANYTGPLKPNVEARARYSVTLQRPDSRTNATFTGDLGQYHWDRRKESCLFVGNSQAGPVYEIKEKNEAVIEGSYSDYIVDQPFDETGYKFGRFNESTCM